MQALEIHPLLEIDAHRAERRQRAVPAIMRIDVLGADLLGPEQHLVHDSLPGLRYRNLPPS